MMWWGDGWGAGWGILMMFLFWGGLIALVVIAARAWGSGGSARPHRPDAREILDERYARGEISEEEYQERRRVLEGVR